LKCFFCKFISVEIFSSQAKKPEKEHLPEYKRFFNLQATIRNRIYNDIITNLHGADIDLGTSFYQNHNREEIMIATLLSEKQNAFSKSIELDEALIEHVSRLLNTIQNIEIEDLLLKFIDKLKNSLNTNRMYEQHTYKLDLEKKVS
jgi:hypothetical protein